MVKKVCLMSTSHMNISKMIIPAAGIGSRFLPITKSIPKEMLPLSNKPAIEHIVQEAAEAGLSDVSIILSPDKTVIIDYFARNHHLERILAEQNKMHYLEELNRLIDRLNFQYFIQNKPMGLANALLHVQPAIEKDEFFAVALPDDIIFGTPPEIARLVDVAQRHKVMVIAVQQVPKDQISAYGIMAPKREIEPGCYEIASLVEKPSIDQAPSNLAIVGRYVFCQELFTFIPQTAAPSGEILLPDTINLMIDQGFSVYALEITGQRFDTGTPAGWLSCVQQGY